MPMDPAQQQSEFSKAYVQAVITAAGFKVGPGALPDDDSVDFSIAGTGPMGTFRSPRIDVQLKSWLGLVESDPWSYSLKVKNYNDLCPTDLQVPRILVVVTMPDNPAEWLLHSEERLELKRCGYWMSLRGLVSSSNTNTVTVHIPKTQLFSPDAVIAMMGRVGNGGVP